MVIIEELIENLSDGFSFQLIGMLLALVALEAVLSADNAVALTALVQDIPDSNQQRQVLNWGMMGAFLLRITLLLLASWIVQFWQFELIGALYLLWLSVKHFWVQFSNTEVSDEVNHTKPHTHSLWYTVSLIAITDLAFSIDSVTAAVALSDQLWIVLTGCMIGIIVLRCLTGLFVRWLAEFVYLESAAYLTVLSVGLRLLIRAVLPEYVPPDWFVISLRANL